jgi:hypothetical protein
MKRDTIDIPVIEMEIEDVFTCAFYAGTNGLKGGDSGHGGRAIIGIKDLGSMDLRCNTNINNENVPCDHVEIVVGGDAEIRSLSGMLRQMASMLESQLEGEGKDVAYVKKYNSKHSPCYKKTLKIYA